MSSNDKCVVAFGETHAQFITDFIGKLGGYFPGLKGLSYLIRETARLTDRRAELNEDTMAELDMKLHYLTEQHTDSPEVVVTYFQADPKKAGGAYQTVTGTIKKIDDFQRVVVMTSGAQIPIDDIYEIDSEALRPLL